MGKRDKEVNKKEGKIGITICIILLIIMIPILIINAWILIDSVVHPDGIPSFIGYKPFIVMSGSMEPTINTGDLAISKTTNTSDLKVGDIISYKYEDKVITHRIIEITSVDGEEAFITQGDNNYVSDTLPVKTSQVEGKYLFKISKAGNIAMFIQKPAGFIIVAAVPIIIMIIAQTISSKNYKKELEELKRKAKK